MSVLCSSVHQKLPVPRGGFSAVASSASWKSEIMAPLGLLTTAMRPTGRSMGGATSLPPCSAAAAAVASTSVTRM
jgi:hypothetical protein